MKKAMILAAVAAMFMFSSCQKEELKPRQNSQSEELVFTASIDQNSTKTIINTDGTDETNRGKIEWVEGDEITITDAESTSVVYVAESSGESVSFKKKEGETGSLAVGSTYSASYKAVPLDVQAYSDYYSAANQAKDLYMTAPATKGTTLTFSAACGLLKFNLTASSEETDKTISKIEITGTPTGGYTTVYTLNCNNESIESAKDFYIALPAGSYTRMKFTNSKGCVCFKKKSSGMTISANKIQSLTLSGIAFTLLPGKFSVSAYRQVQFTRGNLYFNKTYSKYHFEEAQNVTYATLGQSSYTDDHVCHFFWVTPSDATVESKAPWANKYGINSTQQKSTDQFWCGRENPLTVDGQSGLYALTGGDSGEWNYLFNSRNNAYSLFKKGVSITTSAGTVTNCVVIAPDNWDYMKSPLKDSYTEEEWTTAELSGLVCLPAAGWRDESDLKDADSEGYYWSATNAGTRQQIAYGLYFKSTSVDPSESGTNTYRKYGFSVRLVYSEPISVTGVTMSSSAEGVCVGSTKTLSYTLEPTEATAESVVWSTSAESVATVDQNGVVTGVSEGTATITITINGKYTSTCTVTVGKRVLLTGLFSVSAEKQVKFTRGNLYYSTTERKYHIEAAQNVTYKTLGYSGYNANHVCHFYWTTLTESQTSGYEPWQQQYLVRDQTTSDKLFCGEENKMTVDYESDLYALSKDEWNYIFNSRTNASSLYAKGVTVTTSAGTVTNCYVIAPDNWDYTNNPLQKSYNAATWAAAESAGLVCLPAAGYGMGDRDTLYYSGAYGRYWTASLTNEVAGWRVYAYGMEFDDVTRFEICLSWRGFESYSIRLVSTAASK